jgi:DNA polymerase-1
MLQKSARWSTTKPGMTVWTNNGPNKVEKSYYLPDQDDHVLIEIDLSNADARAVAAYSGDTKYAERFVKRPDGSMPDGHLINAWAAWGKEKVGTNKKDPTTAHYRQLAKPGGHGWGYRIGAKKLAKTWKLPVEEAKTFLNNMNKAFRGVVRWQETETEFAINNGYVVTPWGRKMPVDKGREYTQAPALKGQNATREIMCDGLLEMSHAAVRSIKAQIHDAMVFSVPAENWEVFRDYLLRCLESYMEPPGGQRIDFPAECGPPGKNWMEASHD